MESGSEMNVTEMWLRSDFATGRDFGFHMSTHSPRSLATTDNGTGIPASVFLPCNNPDNIIDRATDNGTGISASVFLPCNNPDNIIDRATAKRVESLLNLIVLPSLVLFGVTTNVVNCVVFARQGLKDRIHLCLFSLAVADICFLVTKFTAKFGSFLGLFDDVLREYWSRKFMSTVLGPMVGSLTICNVMALIISLERCVCVLSPFKAKKLLKTRSMLVLILTTAAGILGVSSLVSLKYVTRRVTDPVTNSSRWVLRLSEFYTSNWLMVNVFYNYLLKLTLPCLSLLVVMVTTTVTVIVLRRSLAWRHDSGCRSGEKTAAVGLNREMAVTKMLVVVCLIYVVTMTPSVTQAFFRTLVPGYLSAGKYCNLFSVVQTVVNLCEVTNSSLNFVVYFAMGSQFRSTLRGLARTRPPTERRHHELPP